MPVLKSKAWLADLHCVTVFVGIGHAFAFITKHSKAH